MMRGMVAAGLVAAVLSAPIARGDVPFEDEAGWDCTTMGNHVCGPNSGAVAGCYDDSGHLLVAWPCHAVAWRDGSRHVYFGLTHEE